MSFSLMDVFHTEDYEEDRSTYNNKVCVKESTPIEFEVDYYGKLEKRSFNYNIIGHKIQSFHSNAVGMILIEELG
jgi:hypothetical protein